MSDYKITPNDPRCRRETDSASIQCAVDLAAALGIRSVTVPRVNERTGEAIWNLDQAVILPSEMEIVLDNCHLRQADGSFDNLFRNFENPESEGHTASEQMRNIVIRGVGNAVLDGGVHNGLTQKNSLKDGMPHISRNSLIFLYNLRDFGVEQVLIRRAFLGNCKNVFNLQCDGEISYCDLFGTHEENSSGVAGK